MAGMGAFNPYKVKDFGKKPDLSGIPALLALQGKQLHGGIESGRGIGQNIRGAEIEEQIDEMDLGTATPAQIAKLRGEGSLKPQMIERLKQLSGEAGDVQSNKFKTDAATTLFGRQKDMLGMKHANKLEQIAAEKKIDINNADDISGALSDANQELNVFRTVLESPTATPESKADAQAGLVETQSRIAALTGQMKATSDIKNKTYETAMNTGKKTTQVGGGMNLFTGKPNKVSDVKTADITKGLNTIADPLVRQFILKGINEGEDIVPRYDTYTDKRGVKHRDVVGFSRNGQPVDVGTLRAQLRGK